MEETGLTGAFNTVVDLAQEYALILIVLGGISIWRTLNAVLFGHVLSPSTNVAYTLYVPTGKKNPKTGNEFYRQELYTIEHNVEFTDIFNHATVSWISKKLKAAAKRCSDSNPIVFDFMDDKIFKRGDADEMMRRLVAPKFKGKIGTILQEKFGDSFAWPKKGEKPKKVTNYGILTYERGAKRREFRTLILSEEQIFGVDPALGALPRLEDTLFLDYKTGEYLADSKLPQADRWRTNDNIRRKLQKDKRLKNFTEIYFLEGMQPA